MATDATGTPTPKGIPKYNPDVDAPSGLGFNAAMDTVDSLLDSYVGKPSGIVSGEVPVWNGTTWVRSSVTRINTVRPQDLTQDAATTGQRMMWNGTTWVPASFELAYTEFTANVLCTATTEATANTVVSASAVTFDGSTAVVIEFFASDYDATDAPVFELFLYDGASSIGKVHRRHVTTANSMGAITVSRRLTPSAASHTYSIRGSVSSGSGVSVKAGAGGSGAVVPGYIRITRAV